MHNFTVAVLGASAFTGRELCALAGRHPAVRLAFATANDRQRGHARFGARPQDFGYNEMGVSRVLRVDTTDYAA